MSKETRRSRLKQHERRTGLLFIVPLYAQLIIFLLFFLCYSLYMSFTDWNILAGSHTPVGFANYVALFTDALFWKSIVNTLYLMIGIPIGMFIALFIAMALNRKLAGRNLFRALVYLPAVTSAVAVALLWRWIYNAEYGLLNLLIEQFFGAKGPSWLGDPRMVKISLIIMGIWRGTGSTMILFLAGLQNLPKEYLEVVDVEGGNGFHKFWYVTLPMMTPIIFFVLITGVIGGLQAFGDQFIMTGVGPEHSAMTIVYYLWEKGFAEHNMGQASAVSWVLAIGVFAATLIQFKVSGRWVYDAGK
jgi:multiple sugar transport system permease protein